MSGSLYEQDPQTAAIFGRSPIIQAMLQKGFAPSNQLMISPWQGIAQLANALIGGWAANKQEQDLTALGAQRKAETAAFIKNAFGTGAPSVPAAAPSLAPASSSISTPGLRSQSDTDALVRTVAAEAGMRNAQGQQAVADVILNRARKAGQSVSDIVQQPGQFEPWMTPDGRARMAALDPNSAEYRAIQANITPALQGQDITGGADSFYSPTAQAALGRSPPTWAQGPGQDFGGNRFYTVGWQPPGPRAGGQAVPASGPVAPMAQSGQPMPTAKLPVAQGMPDYQRLMTAAQQAFASDNPQIKALAPMLMQQAQGILAANKPVVVGNQLVNPNSGETIFTGARAPMTVGPGDVVYNPQSRQPEFQAPPRPMVVPPQGAVFQPPGGSSVGMPPVASPGAASPPGTTGGLPGPPAGAGVLYSNPEASPQVQVNVGNEKALGASIAGAAGRQIESAYSDAKTAQESALASMRIKSLLDAGTVTGTGADAWLALKRPLADLFGQNIGQVQNEQQLRAELKRLSFGLMGQMKGQISDKEEQLLKEASGGDIALNSNTLRTMADIQQRAATRSIDRWNAIAKSLGNNQNLDPTVAAIFPQIVLPQGVVPNGTQTQTQAGQGGQASLQGAVAPPMGAGPGMAQPPAPVLPPGTTQANPTDARRAAMNMALQQARKQLGPGAKDQDILATATKLLQGGP